MALQMRMASGVGHASTRSCSQPAVIAGVPVPRAVPSLRSCALGVPVNSATSRSSFTVRAAAADNGNGAPHPNGNGQHEPTVDARTVPSQQVLDIWRNADAVCFDVSLGVIGCDCVLRNRLETWAYGEGHTVKGCCDTPHPSRYGAVCSGDAPFHAWC